MTILKFKGLVNTHCGWEAPGEFLIGQTNVIRVVNDMWMKGEIRDRVTVAIADERFTGDLYALNGVEGYSEWTPGYVAELTVGPHNLIEILDRYHGQRITMWIADEPFNTLEE